MNDREMAPGSALSLLMAPEIEKEEGRVERLKTQDKEEDVLER